MTMNQKIKKDNKGKTMKRCREDMIFDTIVFILLTVILIVVAYPLYWVIISSISAPSAVSGGRVLWKPVGFTMKGYMEVFKNSAVMKGFLNSIIYTVCGVCINLVVTLPTAYALSRDRFGGKKIVTLFYMVTMFFGGGLIPTYLVVSKMHLLNTPWAMMIPGAVSIYNVIITRTYFVNSIPSSLQEAAELDGANTFQFLMKIVLPLSKPIIAVIALYYAVGHWNDFFTALIYLNDKELMPLQSFLRDLLMSNKMSLNNMQGLDAAQAEAKMQLSQTLKYSAIIVSTVPVLCIYPFIQKYFVKGVMIGSVKG